MKEFLEEVEFLKKQGKLTLLQVDNALSKYSKNTIFNYGATAWHDLKQGDCIIFAYHLGKGVWMNVTLRVIADYGISADTIVTVEGVEEV